MKILKTVRGTIEHHRSRIVQFCVGSIQNRPSRMVGNNRMPSPENAINFLNVVEKLKVILVSYFSMCIRSSDADQQHDSLPPYFSTLLSIHIYGLVLSSLFTICLMCTKCICWRVEMDKSSPLHSYMCGCLESSPLHHYTFRSLTVF